MRIEMLEAELEGAKDGHRQEVEQATADLRQTQEVRVPVEMTVGVGNAMGWGLEFL